MTLLSFFTAESLIRVPKVSTVFWSRSTGFFIITLMIILRGSDLIFSKLRVEQQSISHIVLRADVGRLLYVSANVKVCMMLGDVTGISRIVQGATVMSPFLTKSARCLKDEYGILLASIALNHMLVGKITSANSCAFN
eukprot:TRINITY_DN11085_c0_g1_i2.p3 TRINITY_DN11085_c0_g1~~TRINITY_DN11085_c0_g1_i2.p3  ORF type:complete len:138 (+),score=1.55 TRINITY_DN11085_c0_g1_i2:158-571(+)